MANYKAKFISGDPNDASKDFAITFELYRDDRLIAKYENAGQGSGFVPSYTYKRETKEIYIESNSYFYDGFGVWGREGTKYNIPSGDIAKDVKINIEGYTFPETSPPPASAPAQPPSGEILKFVDAFNKEFDRIIDELKADVDEAKLILASMSNISQLKTCSFPEGNASVKTIGDLYKYTYNFETGEDLSLKLKYFSGQIDPSSIQPKKDFDENMDGDTLIPKQNLKPFKSKIESGLSQLRNLKRKLNIKEPQGKNPSLWSPGLYYFEYFLYDMKKIVKEKINYQFSTEYSSALTKGQESFTFSISSFTPDGNIIIKDSPFKQKGFAEDDGQAGYSVFDIMLREHMGPKMERIANLGFQDNEQVWGDPPKPQKVAYQSLKTLYLSGKLEDLKNNPTFQQSRGELSKDGTYFYGNWELISLYKAFKQAGDDYEYVTFPFKEEAKTEPVTTTQSTSTQSQPTIIPDPEAPKFIFNVEDEKTFFRKEPPLELFVVPSTNTTPQQNAPIYPPEDIELDDEALSEEYVEISEFQQNNNLLEKEEDLAEIRKFAESNKVVDDTIKTPAKTTTDKEIIDPNNTQNNQKDDNKPVVEVIQSNSYGLSKLPDSSKDKYSELTKVPYYGQWDTRWGNQIYGSVTTKEGNSLFVEDPNFAKTFKVKNGNNPLRSTTFKKVPEDLLTVAWKNNKFGPVSGKVNINGKIQDFEVQAHYDWHKILGSDGKTSVYTGCGDLGFSTIEGGGCGITSLSMIVNYWGKLRKDSSKAFYTNPIKMAKLACENGGRPGSFPTSFKNSAETPCAGTSYSESFKKALLACSGLKVTSITGKDAITEQINLQRPMLWCVNQSGGLMGNGTFKKYPGHYMVISGHASIDGHEVIIINDPGNPDYKRVVYVKNVVDLNGSFWKFEPANPSDYSLPVV